MYLPATGKTALADTVDPGLYPAFLCMEIEETVVHYNPIRKITANTVSVLIYRTDDTLPMGEKMPIGFLGYQRDDHSICKSGVRQSAFPNGCD